MYDWVSMKVEGRAEEKFIYLFSLIGDVEAEDFTKCWEKKYFTSMSLVKHIKHALKLYLEIVIVKENIIANFSYARR